MDRIKTLFTKNLIPLYLVLILGSWLRLQALLTNSFAFTYDVGRDLIAVSLIANLEKISLIGPTTGLPGVFYGPWWYLILTPFFVLSHGDPRGVEFAMFIAGFLVMVLAYFVGKKISGNFLGVSLASLVAFSPFLIFTSSQIWSPNIAPLFTILTIYILIHVVNNKKIKFWDFLFIGILLGLSIDMEIVYGTLLSVGIIVSLLVLGKSKINIKSISLLMLGILIIFSPRIIFELHHNFLMTNALITFLKSGGDGRLNFIELLTSRLNIFLDEFSQSVAGNNKNFGLILLIFTLISLVLLYKKADEEYMFAIKMCLIVILTFFIGMLFFHHDLYPHYFVGLGIFFIMLVAMAINLLAEHFKNYWVGVMLLLVIIFINFNPMTYISNIGKPLFVGDAAVYRNQLAVIDYVYSEANGEKFKYVVYTPPVNDYTYRYLFSWYGPEKYKYKPSERSNLAFFILEPDYESPQRLTDWLTSRKKDGRIVKSKKLPSGIIIQTRVNK